jgi:hypothetical protein
MDIHRGRGREGGREGERDVLTISDWLSLTNSIDLERESKRERRGKHALHSDSENNTKDYIN